MALSTNRSMKQTRYFLYSLAYGLIELQDEKILKIIGDQRNITCLGPACVIHGVLPERGLLLLC